jgi:hypothetical protein
LATLTVHMDRLQAVELDVRTIARRLYPEVRKLPIVALARARRPGSGDLEAPAWLEEAGVLRRTIGGQVHRLSLPVRRG